MRRDPENKGYFSKCGKGKVYSLSSKGAKSAGVNPKYVKEGIVTGGETKDGVPKTRAKYGEGTHRTRKQQDDEHQLEKTSARHEG